MPCQNCGVEIVGKKAYCAPACREAFHNRASKRGRVAMPLALAWRAKRGGGPIAKAAFQELCAYLDACNAEDRKAGRPPMVDHVAQRGDWNGASAGHSRQSWGRFVAG